MSKDTYSDDKKIESYKGIEIEATNDINILSSDEIFISSEDQSTLRCNAGPVNINGNSLLIHSSSSTTITSGPVSLACTDYTTACLGYDIVGTRYTANFGTVDIFTDHDARILAGERMILQGEQSASLYSPVLVSVGGGTVGTQTQQLHLQARDIFVDGSSVTQAHFVVKGANAKLIADEDHTAMSTYGNYYFVCQKSLNSGYIAYIANTATTTAGDAGDILKLDFPNMSSEGSQRSTYIRFEYGSGDRAGSIYLAASDVAAFRGYEAGTSTSSINADGVGGVGSVNTYPADSGVVYATGNRDFAEWIECGDIEEWSEYIDISVAKKDLPNERHTTHLGLPEGFLAYIRSGMFWKEGPGLPMLVTRSAAMLGNSPKNNTTFIGETFSFIGQINVFVKGQAKSGDYIIPEGNYCIAIDRESANFEDYKKAVGTCISEKDSDSLSQVLCAVGKK